VTCLPAAVAPRLDFVSGSSSRIDVHWNRVPRGWSCVGKMRGEAVRLGEVLDGRSGSRNSGLQLRSPEVGGSESSVSCLVLVELDSGFKPRFRVQIIWPTGSHGGYRIRNRGVKPPSEFDHYGLRVGIAGIRY
jgi:hypothetical protein